MCQMPTQSPTVYKHIVSSHLHKKKETLREREREDRKKKEKEKECKPKLNVCLNGECLFFRSANGKEGNRGYVGKGKMKTWHTTAIKMSSNK